MGGSVSGALTQAVSHSSDEPPSSGPSRAPAPCSVRSAAQAICQWGRIDASIIDVGRYAARIHAAQQRIPKHGVRPTHQIRSSHEKYVRAIAWDPFRELLISGGGDGWIRLWSTGDYTSTGGFNAKLSVRSLLVLTEELVSGHGNGEVIVWAMEQSAKPRLQTLKGHDEAVYSLAMLHNGDLVTAAEDIRVYMHSALTGFQPKQRISEEVLCICTLGVGAQVITGHMNSLLSVWDSADNWKSVAICQGHLRAVWSVCHLVDEGRFASGSADHTIRVWELEKWTCDRVLTDHTSWVVGLNWSPGTLLSCSNDHTVRLWDPTSWTCERKFAEQQYEVYCVCAFGAGRFAAAGAEKTIILYGGPDMVLEHRQDGAADGVEQTPCPTESTGNERRRPFLRSHYVGATRPPGEPEMQDQEMDLDSLRERRAQLMAQSNLDVTISDFRGHLIKAKEPNVSVVSQAGGWRQIPLGSGAEEAEEEKERKEIGLKRSGFRVSRDLEVVMEESSRSPCFQSVSDLGSADTLPRTPSFRTKQKAEDFGTTSPQTQQQVRNVCDEAPTAHNHEGLARAGPETPNSDDEDMMRDTVSVWSVQAAVKAAGARRRAEVT